MNMTVAEVSKVLASVAWICECNNRVVFDDDGSYIEDKATGRRTPMQKKNGVYVVEMRVKRNSEGQVSTIENEGASDSVFRRLGPDLL